MQVIRNDRKILQEAQPPTRCRRSAQGKTPERTGGAGGYDFLNHHFAPVSQDKGDMLKNRAEIERDFYRSLEYLCDLYKIPVPDVQHQLFPLNILAAYRLVKEQLSTMAPDLELEIIETNTQAACLATMQAYSIGKILYYIPVRPLVDLLADPARQSEAELLLYIFAYLYHIVGISWFHNTGSFLDYTYEMMQSWYADVQEPEEEEEEFSMAMLSIFERMCAESDALLRRLRPMRNLRGWRKHLLAFTPSGDAAQELKKVAQATWELYKAYPNRSFWESIRPGLPDQDDEQEESIRPDQYLSFFWDSEDEMYDNLMESINVSLQECCDIEEPVALQVFDQPQAAVSHSLDFEQRLFTLLDDLCTVLNELA
ncbi:MAG: hypothetical protein QM594_16440 [Niabella sp.]